MKLENLTIRNIRNLEDVSIPCDRGIHFIWGLNAQGKTSILESIFLLSNLRSFRDSDVSALLRRGSDQGHVRGAFRIDPTTRAELKIELVRGAARFEKRAYINQKLTRSAVDYFAQKLPPSPIRFHAINLNPASTDLVRGEPGIRRTYLNQVISSESPDYLAVLKHYQQSLDQKNALLKQEHRTEKRIDEELLGILNRNLVQSGAKILDYRLKYLQKITPFFRDFLKRIAPHQETLNLGYKSGETLQFTGQFELQSIENLMENLHRQIVEKGPLERIRKTSLVGPHRDDLMFKVGDRGMSRDPDLVDVGSQGEIRSVLLALKLSELEQFESVTGVQPVLLIDDFSSELDSTRRGFLLNYLKDSDLQIFVTSTDNPSQSMDFSGSLIRMSHGRISE